MDITPEDYVDMLDMVIEKHEKLFYQVPETDKEGRWEIRRDLAIMTDLRLQIMDHYDLEAHQMH